MERRINGRYRLIEPLGEGGMGVVWRAYDELLDRTVAIKEVRYTGVGDAQLADLNRRTIREARAAGRLDHPSVIVIHDVVEEDGLPWIVMQLVKSRSLAEVVRERGPLTVGQAAVIGGRVLDALRAAHATGVLHRDVKPENVLLADDGRVVLTDFGIASLEAEAGLTATGGLVGTPAYMPPERLHGEPARPESDLWSLGATLYTAVEGAPPYKRDSWAATVAAVLRDEPAPPTRAGALRPVIMGLLTRDPRARMGADEAAALLRKAFGEGGTTVPVQTRPRRGGARPVVVASVLAATAALATGAVLAIRWAGAPDPGAATLSTTTPQTGHPATGVPIPTTQGSTGPTPTGATPTGAATSAPASARPTPPATGRQVPDGWRAYRDTAGRFSIAVPHGWQATKHPVRDSVSVTRPGSPGTLIVEWTVPERPWTDPVRHWKDLEKVIQDRGEFTGYRRLAIDPTTYLGRPAADWEFTRLRDGALIHVINRGFRTADGRMYAIYWETTHSRWPRERRYFDTFAQTFRPS
ncbi:protein kinase [Nonomuraea sp. NPDC048916]|uniref:serine/threonine-protein kinase n=1 Tax=Nonomuraea sp. NPDC048916 TaxID=3154232 RepID=UPI0033EA222D